MLWSCATVSQYFEWLTEDSTWRRGEAASSSQVDEISMVRSEQTILATRETCRTKDESSFQYKLNYMIQSMPLPHVSRVRERLLRFTNSIDGHGWRKPSYSLTVPGLARRAVVSILWCEIHSWRHADVIFPRLLSWKWQSRCGPSQALSWVLPLDHSFIALRAQQMDVLLLYQNGSLGLWI